MLGNFTDSEYQACIELSKRLSSEVEEIKPGSLSSLREAEEWEYLLLSAATMAIDLGLDLPVEVLPFADYDFLPVDYTASQILQRHFAARGITA